MLKNTKGLTPMIWWAVLPPAIVKLLVHVLTWGSYGYFRDELYFLDCARHLQWGYVDDAPGFVLLFKLALLLGGSLQVVRLLAALAGVGTVVLAALFARELGGKGFAQLFAGLCVLAAPVCLGVDSILCCGSVEPLFWLGCALLAVRIVRTGNARLWLGFGVVAGLGFLLKRSWTRFLGVFYLLLLAAVILLHGKNYYLAAAYPMLFGAGALAVEAGLERWGKAWPRVALGGLVAVTFLVFTPLVLPLLPPEQLLACQARLGVRPRKQEVGHNAALEQRLGDQFGWRELTEEVAVIYRGLPATERAGTGIYAGNYGQAGAINQFGPALGLPAAICAHQADHPLELGCNRATSALASSGLARKAVTPSSLQVTWSSRSSLALSTTTWTAFRRGLARIRASTARPSSKGSLRSSSTRSGSRPSPSSFRAWPPLKATCTSRNPTSARAQRVSSTSSGLSSTRSTW